ncbi:MAG: hypothetical protein ACRC62_01020 [Microcoleus sp.]
MAVGKENCTKVQWCRSCGKKFKISLALFVKRDRGHTSHYQLPIIHYQLPIIQE